MDDEAGAPNLPINPSTHTHPPTRTAATDSTETDLLVIRVEHGPRGIVAPVHAPVARDGRPAAQESQLRLDHLFPRRGHAGCGSEERGRWEGEGRVAEDGGDGCEDAPGVVGGVVLQEVPPLGPVFIFVYVDVWMCVRSSSLVTAAPHDWVCVHTHSV